MKVKSTLTTLLCGLLSVTALLTGAALSRAETADAAASKTHYPEVFKGFINDDMPNITDFATDGETFVFADRTCIMEVRDGTRKPPYKIPHVSALDCDGENFYYRLGTQGYNLHNDEPVKYEFRTEFPSPPDGDYKILETADSGGSAVYFCAKNSLNFQKIVGSEGATKLKTYNNTIYALLPDGVYRLDGLNAPESINPSYTDFSAAETISVGSTIDDLKAYSLQSPHMAMLERDSFFTELTLNNLLGVEYFTVGGTYSEESEIFPFDDPVLILCETGNAAIFTYGGKTYMTLADNCVEVEFALSDTDFSQAIVCATDAAYCAPYIGDALKISELNAGAVVKVIGKTEKTNAVGDEFYLIEYETAGGEKTRGYALKGMLIAYYGEETPSAPDDKNYQPIEDADYSEKDLVKVVILVVVVILLVLIAIGYLVYVATKKKKQDK